jgi:anti-sigma regulatory factor (Ser/Thr protein kinase)
MTVSDGSRRAVFEVPASPRAPALARHLVGEFLRGWGLAVIADDTELAVSEMVTNAVQHAPGSGSHLIEVVRGPRGVRVTVADESPALPILRPVQSTGGRGRGLHILAALGTAWGVELHEGGKRVWVEFAVDASTAQPVHSGPAGTAPQLVGFPVTTITDEQLSPTASSPPAPDRPDARDDDPAPDRLA